MERLELSHQTVDIEWWNIPKEKPIKRLGEFSEAISVD
jgi:hypothetical protein